MSKNRGLQPISAEFMQRVVNIQHEIAITRGFEPRENEEPKVVSKTIVDGEYRIDMNRLNSTYFRGNDTLYVYYFRDPAVEDKNLGVEDIRVFTAVFQRKLEESRLGKLSVILIMRAAVASAAKNDLKELMSINDIQTFVYSELMFNVTKHRLVPRHELVSAAEQPALIRDLKTSINFLPIIKKLDPIVKFYNWPMGGIVRIYRENLFIHSIIGESIYYRRIAL